VNKAELIAHVAKDSELPKDAAEKAVEATLLILPTIQIYLIG
jgi:nucleoid DNA-binding protein